MNVQTNVVNMSATHHRLMLDASQLLNLLFQFSEFTTDAAGATGSAT